MSMLSSQADELRSWADQLSEREDEFGVVVRALVADLRKAADTITSLSDKLQGVMGTKYCELFGTPERAARTLETVAESLFSSAWSDDTATLSDVACALSTTCGECPAKSAKGHGITTRCGEVDYDALLEWLRGDAE